MLHRLPFEFSLGFDDGSGSVPIHELVVSVLNHLLRSESGHGGQEQLAQLVLEIGLVDFDRDGLVVFHDYLLMIVVSLQGL